MKTLWTDAPDALDQLGVLYRDKLISDQTRDDLDHFIRHGYLIRRNAIQPALIDAFVRDIRTHHLTPGMFVTTDHRSGSSKLKLSGTTPETFESLFDLYVNLESARRVCFHPSIVGFLATVFRTRPVAMQQLLFQRSNGHLVHQDTSVVAVEDPLLLVASWIALEDVVEGAGELAFYGGSHRLPHYLFKDGTKRFDGQVDDGARYAQELDQACRDAGYPYERFMAKKGDVLFWTADLVHRSHPRVLPDTTSRLSCVTHYYPATTEPFWFRYYKGHKTIVPYDSFAGYVSMYYPLDQSVMGMIPPVLQQ
ncbi:phytanoyl-CoA dioxygenase family protein [Rhodopila sp.]|uniref:phytanoyl-CoA dioxygenase family protein n=1 Tax=Rhodopila sp. TaxID=2480087 RepID=UPI002B9702E9|nr:phytanoyl-CoA dioxygenase family protein [Rhodopila sp.]HVZ06387.1 phytanoyl-CoA dioxygenase family protein [Rhodopila sp.]